MTFETETVGNCDVLAFIKLVYSTATKDLWSKKTFRYSYKKCHNFEEYCVWKGQAF